MVPEIKDYLKKHREEQLAELLDFLRIPGISALSEHKPDIRRSAEWLAAACERAGLEHVEIISTAGNPIVYADWLHAPGKPTALIYGHYDVQPVDPLNLWETPPFEPDIRDGKLYARGSSDDKGQVFMHVKAAQTVLQTTGTLPVNMKFCIEGEEEIGSGSFPSFLQAHADKLQADVVVISDSTMYDEDRPAICYALRGMCALQIDVRGARGDLHSGLYGGGVPNAVHALVELLATLHDAEGRIAVAGFYDTVAPLSEQEKSAFQDLNFDEEKAREELGLPALFGETGFSFLERIWARPTLEINGIYGGFQGEGSKTVIPCEAHAKITCRLVADQNPQEIMDLIAKHIDRHTPAGVTVNMTRTEAGHPFLTPFAHPFIQAAARAYEHGYEVAPVYIRGGGSIPVVETLHRIIEAPVVLMGFALSTENFHAPNEHFHLTNFDKGLLTLCSYWHELSSAQ